MSNISIETGLPDIVSVQKRVYPLLFLNAISTQPTKQPIATAYGLKRSVEQPDDGSGWRNFNFRLDRWFDSVSSNKLKTEISIEALTDMRALGLDETMITDHLADQISDDINQDLLAKLNEISTVGAGISVAAGEDFDQARNLYASIHIDVAVLEGKTGCTGTYVICGGDTYGLMLASGMVTKVEGTNYSIAQSGLFVMNDKYSATNYVTIGVKKVFGETELSSIVFSPYDVDGSGGLAYQLKVTDPNSLNPVFGVIARYAVTAAPLEDNAQQSGNVQQIPWGAITADHRSELSITHVVTIA